MSADKCSECGSPLKPEDEYCKGCDDALLVPLVPDIPEDLTEPDGDSIPVNEEPAKTDENEPHLSKVLNKSKIVATASVLIFILVIGALFSFTDIFSRNDTSESPDEDAGIQEYSGLYVERFVLENPRELFAETPEETITNDHESTSNNLLELRNVLNTYFEEEGLHTVYAFLDERGLVIYIQGAEIFDYASEAINTGGLMLLRHIRTLLRNYSFEHILIEYHTDILDYLSTFYDFSHHNDPFDTRIRNIFPIFLEFFDEGTAGFDFSHVGPSNPIATNTTEEGRLLNNRIEIVFKHDFDTDFLETHSTFPREHVPGFNTQLETVIGKLIGCWQTEWVDRNGDEQFWEFSFYNNFMFSLRAGEKDSESVTEIRGSYSLDLHSDRIRLNGQVYPEFDIIFLEFVTFFFIRENLLLFFEGAEPFVFSRAESLDS